MTLVAAASDAVSTGELRRLVAALSAAPVGSDDAERIDRIALLEDLRGVVAGAQLAESAAFDRSQRAGQAAAGEPPARQGRGVAGQLGLARRVSHYQAGRWLGVGPRPSHRAASDLCVVTGGADQ